MSKATPSAPLTESLAKLDLWVRKVERLKEAVEENKRKLEESNENKVKMYDCLADIYGTAMINGKDRNPIQKSLASPYKIIKELFQVKGEAKT